MKGLDAVLTYHVVAGVAAFSKDLRNGEEIKTVEGEDVVIKINSAIRINDATVTNADIAASNGVVHIIDTVLTVPKPTIATVIAANPDLSTFVVALGADKKLSYELNHHIENGACPPGCGFTVFAPTNEAPNKIPASKLDFLLDPANLSALNLIPTHSNRKITAL